MRRLGRRRHQCLSSLLNCSCRRDFRQNQILVPMTDFKSSVFTRKQAFLSFSYAYWPYVYTLKLYTVSKTSPAIFHQETWRLLSNLLINLTFFHSGDLSPVETVPPWGTPILKRRGCSLGILKRTPRKYQDPVSWAWFEFFSPLGGTSPKTHNLLSERYQEFPPWTFWG